MNIPRTKPTTPRSEAPKGQVPALMNNKVDIDKVEKMLIEDLKTEANKDVSIQ